MQVVLTEAEKELLLKACKKYRYTIPAYLESKQPELQVIDALIDKLT